MHEGFPNEYLVVVVVQCNADGIPLIRDIENAEPCGDAVALEGTGEGTIGLDMETVDGGGFIAAP
jgi:hypothetical protein